MSSRPTTGPGPIPLEQQIVEGGPVQGNGDGHENGGPRTVSLKASGTLIDRLRATRVWMLSIVLLAVGIAAVKMYLDPVQYSSSAVLLFAEQDPLAATSQARPSTDATQLYQLAASTEMFDHLIARFDLYDHYEVDTLRPLHYAETVSLLQRNMSVNLLDVNCLAITVRDAGRAMAAAMANEAFSKLQDITEQRSLAQMQRAVATYQQVIQHTEDRYREQSEHLLELVTEFKELSGPYADTQVTERSDDQARHQARRALGAPLGGQRGPDERHEKAGDLAGPLAKGEPARRVPRAQGDGGHQHLGALGGRAHAPARGIPHADLLRHRGDALVQAWP